MRGYEDRGYALLWRDCAAYLFAARRAATSGETRREYYGSSRVTTIEKKKKAYGSVGDRRDVMKFLLSTEHTASQSRSSPFLPGVVRAQHSPAGALLACGASLDLFPIGINGKARARGCVCTLDLTDSTTHRVTTCLFSAGQVITQKTWLPTRTCRRCRAT